MPKSVAASLTSVLDDPRMVEIQDRTKNVEDLATKMLDEWSLDLFTRKPGPAVNANGEFQGTDLDLATFMTALSIRNAVIVLPSYKGMRASTVREGERRVGTTRNGSIMTLYSNKEAFSFGVRIKDMSIVQTDPVTGQETHGAPRNFSLVDVKGEWHKGWDRIEFSPTAKENDFLRDHKVWTGNTYVVKNFIHPNRWMSIYGNPYFMAKAMVQRLQEEAKFLRDEIKRLQENGTASRNPAKGPRRSGRPPNRPGTLLPSRWTRWRSRSTFQSRRASTRPCH